MVTLRWLSLLGVLALLVGSGAGCNGANSAPRASAPAAPSEASSSKVGAQPVAKQLGTPQSKLPVGTLVLETPPREPITLAVEVASNDAQRQTGMMFREQLGDREGMLFVFPTERRNSFWMHNTLIPLDMIFIDSEWKVVGVVENATPQTDDPRGVNRMSQYVLEVNGGFAAKNGITTDTVVRYTPPNP